MNAPRQDRVAVIALLLGATAIGFAPIFVRLSELPPTSTAFHRMFLSLPVLWLWMALEPRRGLAANRPVTRSDILKLAMAGLFFAADMGVWHWSLRFTSVANSTFLANLAPVLVTLAAWFFFREKPRASFLAGLTLAIGGALMLMGDSLSLSTRFVLGDALGLLTAVFYASYILAVGRLRERFSTATIMAWSGLAAALGLLPVALASGEALLPQTWTGLSILLGAALFSHAGGQSLIAYGLAHLPASFGAVVLLLQPVVATVLAWALLGESLSLLQGIGGLIVLMGIAWARRSVRK